MEADELSWDVSAEQSVIGSILLSPNCLPEVERDLRPSDFRLEADRVLYEAALALERAGDKLDVVTILDRAAKMGRPVSREYAFQLLEITPTAANVGAYIQIVREDVLRNGLMGVSETIRAGVLGRETPQTVLVQGAQMLTDLMTQGNAGRLSSPTEQMAAFYRQRDAIDSGDAKGYVCTGYMALDKLLGGGMINSGLYLLAARPGMGKTTLALNIADRVAQADPVLFVSLEMDDEQLTAKRISRETGISSEKLLMQPLNDQEYAQVAAATQKLSTLSLYTNKAPAVTVDDISALARSIGGLRLIVVDYFGKIAPPPDFRRSGRVEYTTENSGALKDLARSLKVPVLALCQLNREVETRQDKRPQLSDLRDTGALEQDADGVIFLYREDYYAAPGTIDPNIPSMMEVNLAKNRHGFVGKCEMAFSLASSRITSVSRARKGAAADDPFPQTTIQGA